MAKGNPPAAPGFMKKLSTAMRATRAGINSMERSINKSLGRLINVTSESRRSMSGFLALQESALSRGQDLMSVVQESGRNIGTVADSVGLLGMTMGEVAKQGLTFFPIIKANTTALAGFGAGVEVAMDAFHAGLDTNNASIGRLLIANKFTEKSSKQLAKMFRANTVGLGLSTEEMSSLANTTLRLQQQFGLTTTELQGAISALGKRLSEFAVLGLGKQASEAAMMMGGAMGIGAEKMGAELISALTDPDNLAKVAAAGLGDQLADFYEGGSWEDSARLAFDAAQFSAKTIEKWAGKDINSIMLRGKMLQSANRAFGSHITDGGRMYKEIINTYGNISREDFINRLKVANKQEIDNNKIAKTWEAVKSKIMGPIQEVLLSVMTAFLNWSKTPAFAEFIVWIKKAAAYLAAWSLIVKPALSLLSSLMKTLWVGWKILRNVIWPILRKVWTVTKWLVTVAIPFLVRSILRHPIVAVIVILVSAIWALKKTIIGALANLPTWLGGGYFENWLKEINTNERKAALEEKKRVENQAALDASLKQIDTNELLRKSSEIAIADERRRKDSEKNARKSNDLLNKINENLKIESIRNEFARLIDEKTMLAMLGVQAGVENGNTPNKGLGK